MPSYGSLIILIERWFAALTTKKLKRSHYCSAVNEGPRVSVEYHCSPGH
jgi:hypothetical protein